MSAVQTMPSGEDGYGMLNVSRYVTLTDETGYLRITMQISAWYQYDPGDAYTPETMTLDRLIVFGADGKFQDDQCRECVEASPMIDDMLGEAWRTVREV